MDISFFDYNLPKSCIAHTPASPRDACKLLLYDKKNASITDTIFYDIENYLKPGDVLVLNDTRVIPARLLGKKDTGGNVEVFLIKELFPNNWHVLIRGSVRVGTSISFEKSFLRATVSSRSDSYSEVIFTCFGFDDCKSEIYRIGRMPLPPYIISDSDQSSLRDEYQTVYSVHDGSVAAPTAGLHFTNELLSRLQKKGVILEYVTLHVGLGTFNPVRTQIITDHVMHPEYVVVDADVSDRLCIAKKNGQRIIAVGTTCVRVLESVVSSFYNGEKKYYSFAGEINMFIYPGYEFGFIDGLITNFHLPKSTLLMLVSAFMGRENCLAAYKHAIEHSYRFYSFGDAMFIF